MCAVGSPSVMTMICLFPAAWRVRRLRASRSPASMLVKCWGTRLGGLSRSNRRWTRLSKRLTGLGAELSSCRSVMTLAYV